MPLSLTLTEIHIYLPQRNSGAREPNTRTKMRCNMLLPAPPPLKGLERRGRVWLSEAGVVPPADLVLM